MSGLDDKAKGTAKEVAGDVTGDEKLKSEGKGQQIVGNLKERTEDVKDTVEEKFEETKDAVGEKASELLDKVKGASDKGDK